jgi:hypothetical protein
VPIAARSIDRDFFSSRSAANVVVAFASELFKRDAG